MLHRLSTLRDYHRVKSLMWRAGLSLKAALRRLGIPYERGKRMVNRVERSKRDRRCGLDRRHAVRTTCIQRRDGRERRVAGPWEVECPEMSPDRPT